MHERSQRGRWLAAIMGAVLLAASCAPTTGTRPSGQSPSAGEAPAATTPSRTLRIAFQGFEEPKSGVINYGGVSAFDPLEHFLVFHASLTTYDPKGQLIPRLAEKVPTIQDGDWKTLPDGTMDVTWKLKPSAKWQDGKPLRAEDFVFGLDVLRDPEVPVSRPAWLSLVSTAEAVDSQTLVIHWKQQSFLAGGLGGADIPAIPVHILSDLYQTGDKHAFVNSTFWTTDFIGLGPYKLAQWQRGSFIEGLAFDGFVLGKPKIERILLTYIGDVNAIVGSILSGDMDMVPMGARFDATQLMAVQNGWGPDGGMTMLVPFGVRTVWLQFRDPNAPWVRDIRIRRAMAHSTDRQGMSDALQYGMTTPADTFLLAEDSGYPAVERAGLARYPYDVDRARQLMAEAGWTLGGDRMLRDAAGQPLTVDLSATGQGSNLEEIQTVSDQWRGVGFQASPVPLPPQAGDLDEKKNTVKGGFVWPWTPSPFAPQNLSSGQIPTDRTAWKGANYSGYNNAAYDEMYRRFTTTLDTAPRQQVQAEIMAHIADEVPLIPIYYYGNGVIARKGLSGPAMISPYQTSSLWNLHTWTWQS